MDFDFTPLHALMTQPHEPQRIDYDGSRLGWILGSLVRKVLALAAAAVLLVGAIAFSIVAFAVIAAGILIGGAYLAWKTRDLRKQMRASSERGNVIEGEVITRVVRDVSPHERDLR